MGPLRVVEHEAIAYSREWRGTLFTSFVSPLLYLAAMGIGLGSLVDRGSVGAGGDLTYLAWLAPGLLAASRMHGGAFENSWPVVAGFHWHGYFEAAVTTRIRPRDIVVGRLLWTGVRLLVILVIFVVMAALLGAIELAPGFGAVGPALLSGLVTGLLVQAVASHLFRSDQLANVFRYGVVPTFLFSGTFFPISQLPTLMQPLAWLTPLWHGVELSRAVALDEPTAAPALVHLGALVAMGALGFVLSARQFDRRLIS